MLMLLVSSSTPEIHLRSFSHVLTCFYTSLLCSSMLDPNLLCMTYGFHVCQILLLCSVTRTTSFAQLQLCISLTDRWQVVCSYGVSTASLCLISSHPMLVHLRATSCVSAAQWRAAVVPGLYFSTLHRCVRVASISLYIEQLLVPAISRKIWSYHTKMNKSKPNQLQTPGQLEKLLSQLKQVKSSCRQVTKSSGRASLTNLSPEALQIQCKACSLLLSMAVLYYRAM